MPEHVYAARTPQDLPKKRSVMKEVTDDFRSLVRWYVTFWRKVEYVGETKFGVPHGQGRMRAREFAEFDFVEYEGEFAVGVFHGAGKSRYLDQGIGHGDEVYEGEFLRGERGPVGLLERRNGQTYEGAFENGRPCGPGIATWPNGRKYAGEFHGAGQPGWEGHWTWPGDTARSGRITDQSHYHYVGPGPHANPWQFTLELDDGSTFRGGCSEGWPHGQGTWTFRDGTQYEGNFVDGLAQEPGKWTLRDGKVREGEFSLTYPTGEQTRAPDDLRFPTEPSTSAAGWGGDTIRDSFVANSDALAGMGRRTEDLLSEVAQPACEEESWRGVSKLRWAATALGIAIVVWLLAGVIAYIADWRDDSERLASQRETQGEWESLIGSSCDLPAELTDALSKELAVWNPWDSPVYLLSDFERIMEFEALVRPSFALDVDVPTDPPGLVRYRFGVAARALALANGSGLDDHSPVIDGCAGEVHKALTELEEEIEARVREVFGEEGVDYDEDGPLPRVDTD